MRYFTMRRFASNERRDGGQVLVIFALALVAIVAMTGLVLDGGSTFVQRRDMQNVTDSAAMAAGYAYSLGGTVPDAAVAARSTAASNGYVNGTGGVTVDLSADNAGGAGRHFTVTITRPHPNNFDDPTGDDHDDGDDRGRSSEWRQWRHAHHLQPEGIRRQRLRSRSCGDL